jgi:hypothetical protein
MSDPQTMVGYCTNVHAGIDVDAILGNLRTHALAVRNNLKQTHLPVGLWFSENAVREALETDGLARIQRGMKEMGLVAYTLNGFPQGDFHSEVVKHRVYLPTWWDPSRLQYTRNLVQLLDLILEPGRHGSISTLPIAWGNPMPTPDQWRAAADQLVTLAEELHRRFETTGRHIVLALEPEPGCAITDTASLRKFFADYLSERQIGSNQADRVRRYLTMCHDVCHAAVMGEDQKDELLECDREGIRIGKVQISSAIRVRWNTMQQDERTAALKQLDQFAEDRYLHQTMVLFADGRRKLHEDLPGLIKQTSDANTLSIQSEWRIHFHVPIDVVDWGPIETTRNEIVRFIDIANAEPQLWGPERHFEVETYAWGVLPETMRVARLHEGIARELKWLDALIASRSPSLGVERHA